MPFRADLPFDDMPLLPPDRDLETRTVLKACVGARAALAELRTAGQLIPNQAILINSIPILEAQASSEIENIVTTADRLFRFANDAGGDPDPATKEALRYRTALYQGFRMLEGRPLSTNLAIDVCRLIRGIDATIRDTPGTALMDGTSGRLVYTPPQGAGRLRDLLSNWERYIHGLEDVDPLVRMAVQHYQFEAIHPFTDGNGRTGRVLNILFLVQAGLLDLPVLYLSRYIIQNRRDYYRLLQAVTAEAAWEPWILYMLAAVAETARWTTARVRTIRDLLDITAETVRSRAPKVYTRELVELTFVQPYCRISDVVAAGIVRRQSASTYLKALVDVGVLEEVRAGREKLFINPALLRVLAEP